MGSNNESPYEDKVFFDFQGKVRVDKESKRFSALDIIAIVTGKRDRQNNHRILRHSSHECRTLRHTVGKNDAIHNSIEKIRINGKGKPTPVIGKDSVKKFILLLPCRNPELRNKLLDYLLYTETFFWESRKRKLEETVYKEAEDKLEEIKQESRKVQKKNSYHDLIKDFFAEKYNGQVEVRNCFGVSDVETHTHVFEVKETSKWKHAFGQVQAYAYATKKKPCVILFGKRLEHDIEKFIKDSGVGLVYAKTLFFSFN